MGRTPSFALILNTAWGLLRARGWLILAITLAASIPAFIYLFGIRFGYSPSLTNWTKVFLGPTPNLSEDGMLTLLVYLQFRGALQGTAMIFVFGWFQAIQWLACSRIAINWYSGETHPFHGLKHRLIPSYFVVWAVIVITTVSGLVGNILLFIPSMVMAVIWYVAKTVAAVENVTPIQALSRSLVLTRKFRGVILVLVCSFIVLDFGWGFFRATVIAPWVLDAGFEAQDWFLIDLGLRSLMGSLFYMAGMIVTASAYLVLKRAESGPDDQEISEVFT